MYSELLLSLLLSPTAMGIFCPGLGDFLPDPPFEGWPDPTCPGDITLELYYEMYSTATGDVPERFDRNSIPSNFDSSLETIFIIHGWTNDEDTLWMDFLIQTIVQNRDMNVVKVAWGGPGGSQNPNYWESASTTRTVGAETAYVMVNLIESGGGRDTRMWCSGHSLGAHTCGHMGRTAKTLAYTLDRVTGMDPAGPNFASNADRTVGIAQDVARFVDIIHTDNVLGSAPDDGVSQALILGHSDFFLNGGNTQPGCATDTCDHLRAYQVFEDSITNNCYEADQECTDGDDFPGSCSSCISCPQMGFDVSRLDTGIFTVPAPNEDPPYVTPC